LLVISGLGCLAARKVMNTAKIDAEYVYG